VRLAEQWSEIQGGLPQGWRSASVVLTLDDPEQADRAALVLGPAAPGRDGASFRIEVVREAQEVGTSAELLRRVLQRLDADGVTGRLELAGTAGGVRDDGASRDATSLAGQWRALMAALPPDWSHLLARVELGSSDYLDRAALLLAPANPTAEGARTLYFRAARRVGYGVAPQMAERCLARLDEEGIGGRLEIVHVVSESQPVATQGGPVWRVGGRVA
jgi:hypothetical protein